MLVRAGSRLQKAYHKRLVEAGVGQIVGIQTPLQLTSDVKKNVDTELSQSPPRCKG